MKILFLLILSLLGFQACAEMCDERGPVGGGICTKDDECNKDRVTERKKDKRGDTTTERIIKDYNTQFGKNYCDLSITIKNITSGKCVCSLDFTMEYCSYQRYNKNSYGFFQCLIGIGNLVVGRTGQGLLQMMLILIPIIIDCCCGCCGCGCANEYYLRDKIPKSITKKRYLALFVVTSAIIWTFIDAGFIFSGTVKDGNGYYPYNTDCTFV